MTTVLPIPGGLLNKEIVDLAYTVLGLSDSMFGRTEEQNATGMVLLRAMMTEHPFDKLGFDDGDARLGGESGVERKWLTALGYSLGKRLADAHNKTLKPNAQATLARSFSALCAAVATISTAKRADGTPMGAGHRIWQGGVFFPEGE